LTAPVRSGDVLAGKYRVDRVLGEGGMGVVVAATHVTLDQKVALKFLLPHAIANPEALARFLREARSAVRLKSEHVARVIDVATLETGAPYIVMEYLAGTDLGGWLERERSLSIPVAVDFVLQACDAIAEAHALGIVHRDLKPQNLFVTRGHDGTNLVKVLDFGISKTMMGGDAVATATHAVMGSPAYMSPEQMRSAKFVDQRSDIWALGVILYQLVVGRTPWHGDTFTDLAFKVAMDPLPPLPGGLVPAGFEAVVRRCLEKDPARRYPDVPAFAAALAPFAPPHAQALVERIARIARSDPSCADASSARAHAEPAPTLPLNPSKPSATTIGAAAGQSLNVPQRRGRKRALVTVLGAVAVIGGIAIVAATSIGGDDTGARPALARPAIAPTPTVPDPPPPKAEPAATPSPTPAPESAPIAPPVVTTAAPTPTHTDHSPSPPTKATAKPARRPPTPPPTHTQGSAQPPGGKLPDF
jgi:serine/threonine-protein kinase